MELHGLIAAIETGPAVVLFLAIAAISAAVTWMLATSRGRAALAERQADVQRLVAAAKQEADAKLAAADVEAQRKYVESVKRFEEQTAETRKELKESDRRLQKREDALEQKMEVLVTKERKIELAEQKLAQTEQEFERKQAALNDMLSLQRGELLRITKMTPEQARAACLKRFEQEVEIEAGQIVDRLIGAAEENARERARYIVINAIQRYAAEHTCESVVNTIDVPNDEMKGRVIGREGRNIRAFEKATGVEVIVDDTPGIVTVSCFDPVRREVARLALERLIKDGRIHPTRIEELVAETQKEVEQRAFEAGRQAAQSANVPGLHRKIVELLGRLHYRTSYGQNVLKHSVEVAHLCALMADELGLDAAMARRCGLLHDIGKAITHDEAQGSHTRTGHEFAKRFAEAPQVLNAIAGHHGDVAATSPYTPLVTSADAISAARPGARRESLERYIKRLRELEEIATGFEGVRQAYAIEAGREVRVIVDAVKIDDRSSLKLARDVARRIEEQIATFPGEIKVSVLREVRATEYAISGRYRNDDRGGATEPFLIGGPPGDDTDGDPQPAEDEPRSGDGHPVDARPSGAPPRGRRPLRNSGGPRPNEE